MVFAFLFGLSMDYEVFILARMPKSATPPAPPIVPSPRAQGEPAGW
jgi:hypothetical protein